ncbi:hypothetical protein [Pseudomonas fluorescens]|uniref:hypothetical protein n=1 Tax=Pseudomonas fluorescens TaxID=294 RepID=UPI0020057ED6|nr:hypothetical protein [Pseudomonas fluorescens]MCK3831670.1 hypothetical protein [Pseudomonas fluorescens]
MMKMHFLKYLSCMLVGTFGLTSNAANYVKLTPMEGQCETTGINNHAIAVGNCSPLSSSANNTPWVVNVSTPDSQVELAPLMMGQPCYASAVSNGGWIAGICKNANNVETAVIWNATTPSSTPTALAPLPGTLLRAADARTTVKALNQRGDMIGSSISSDGKEYSTVVWLAGTGTPTRIFSSLLGLAGYNDACFPVDINNTLTSGYPAIAMNCPGSSGTTVPKIAQAAATGYTVTSLPIATGANLCLLSGLNDALQAIGFCEYPNINANPARTAFWNTPASAPLLLNLTISTMNYGRAINNNGIALVERKDNDGRTSYLTWIPPAGIFGIQLIELPLKTWAQALSIADNNTVVLNITDNTQYPVGCIWRPASSEHPAQYNCLDPIEGGQNSALKAFSQSGNYAAGQNVNSEQDVQAVAVKFY